MHLYNQLTDLFGYFLTNNRFNLARVLISRFFLFYFKGFNIPKEMFFNEDFVFFQSYSLYLCCCIRIWVSANL